MSVIENAIEKLRRESAGAGAERAAPPPPRGIGSAMEQPRYDTASRRNIAVDSGQLRAAGYLPESGHELEFVDGYRELKRPIIRRCMAAGASPQQRLVMVTSALPGEGKTFTTLNLALSIAREQDASALLVDADFPRSQISRLLGIQEEPGVLDAVADSALDVESLVLGTSIKGLEVLPAGRLGPRVAELVASARMNEVMARLTRDPRRIVVLDSAPLLVASEARAMIHVPGQVLLVARSGRTAQGALQDAIALLDRERLQGIVLNDVRFGRRNGGYYGYYGYQGSAKHDDESAGAY